MMEVETEKRLFDVGLYRTVFFVLISRMVELLWPTIDCVG